MIGWIGLWRRSIPFAPAETCHAQAGAFLDFNCMGVRAMQTLDAHWEDEENSRRVAYSVGFTRQGEAVEIGAITPKQVTFVCPESKQPLRTIGVWTDRGRQLLTHQLRNSGELSNLERKIETGLAV
jgi:hypothetical protein